MNSLTGPSSQNIIYLYDLPKKEYTSVKLAEILKNSTGVELERQPTVRRDINRPFYSAIIGIEDDEKFKKAVDALRYFEFDGKPCRGLPFDPELLGSNISKLNDNNVFVRKIPVDMKPQELEKEMSRFGKIKSLKISRHDDYTSKGYGFVCFEEQEGAIHALEALGDSEERLHCIKFSQKDKHH